MLTVGEDLLCYGFVFQVISTKVLRRNDGSKDWQFGRHFYMRVIIILIDTSLGTSSLISLCFSFGIKKKEEKKQESTFQFVST